MGPRGQQLSQMGWHVKWQHKACKAVLCSQVIKSAWPKQSCQIPMVWVLCLQRVSAEMHHHAPAICEVSPLKSEVSLLVSSGP